MNTTTHFQKIKNGYVIYTRHGQTKKVNSIKDAMYEIFYDMIGSKDYSPVKFS